MSYITVYEEYDMDAQDFRDKAWSGGADTLEDLTDDEIETIFSYLMDGSEDGKIELTELNDFFWFERDTIAEWLGYDSYDDLMGRDL